MRGGKFLAEESPDDLKSKYQCDTLEEVFLKLAILQNMGKRRRSSIAQEICEQVSVPAALSVCIPHKSNSMLVQHDKRHLYIF